MPTAVARNSLTRLRYNSVTARRSLAHSFTNGTQQATQPLTRNPATLCCYLFGIADASTYMTQRIYNTANAFLHAQRHRALNITTVLLNSAQMNRKCVSVLVYDQGNSFYMYNKWEYQMLLRTKQIHYCIVSSYTVHGKYLIK